MKVSLSYKSLENFTLDMPGCDPEEVIGLNLSFNKLTELPAEIGKLVKLEWLVVENNQLTALPAEIGKLERLKILDLENNQLTKLPEEIGKLVKLETLWLIGNPLSSREIQKIKRLLPKDCEIYI